MNNVELAKKVEGYLKGSAAKAKKFEDLVAVSISLLSENNEDMFVAVRDGKILVDHYAYNDNNCAVEASAETIDKMFSGELSFDDALASGAVQVKSGETAKLKALECLVPSAKSAKTSKVPVKPAEKKAAAGKAEKVVADTKATEKADEKAVADTTKAPEKAPAAAKAAPAPAVKSAEKKPASVVNKKKGKRK